MNVWTTISFGRLQKKVNNHQYIRELTTVGSPSDMDSINSETTWSEEPVVAKSKMTQPNSGRNESVETP